MQHENAVTHVIYMPWVRLQCSAALDMHAIPQLFGLVCSISVQVLDTQMHACADCVCQANISCGVHLTESSLSRYDCNLSSKPWLPYFSFVHQNSSLTTSLLKASVSYRATCALACCDRYDAAGYACPAGQQAVCGLPSR